MGTLNWSEALVKLLEEVTLISLQQPRERLPKEEQLRCALYHWLRVEGADYVHVEPNYGDIDTGRRAECDLRASFAGLEYWIELKRGYLAAPRYNASAKEHSTQWAADVSKLCGAPTDARKVFVMIGLSKTGFRTKMYTDDHLASVSSVIQSLTSCCAKMSSYRVALEQWREVKGIDLLGCAWEW